jgi:hypothetical protein
VHARRQGAWRDPFRAAIRACSIVDRIRLYDERQRNEGLDLVTVSVRRPPADVLDPRVKSLNYLNSVLAKREARLRGADEALVLNAQGHIAEAAVANVFCVRDGVLLTPPATDGALEGITRRTVLELARELAIRRGAHDRPPRPVRVHGGVPHRQRRGPSCRCAASTATLEAGAVFGSATRSSPRLQRSAPSVSFARFPRAR